MRKMFQGTFTVFLSIKEATKVIQFTVINHRRHPRSYLFCFPICLSMVHQKFVQVFILGLRQQLLTTDEKHLEITSRETLWKFSDSFHMFTFQTISRIFLAMLDREEKMS